jgi:hypothetical protein
MDQWVIEEDELTLSMIKERLKRIEYPYARSIAQLENLNQQMDCYTPSHKIEAVGEVTSLIKKEIK